MSQGRGIFRGTNRGKSSFYSSPRQNFDDHQSRRNQYYYDPEFMHFFQNSVSWREKTYGVSDLKEALTLLEAKRAKEAEDKQVEFHRKAYLSIKDHEAAEKKLEARLSELEAEKKARPVSPHE
eukprot:TRINITY_DN1334_c0_g2_i12.p2 TRINITY_DN1334_c0_g2~~TRINITY_DN1334_c0_g2_i12.p2  ORF type:complete len:123 (-),score=5.64 TRINITY_DN1334_c0_g2_i12:3549-3917(-)